MKHMDTQLGEWAEVNHGVVALGEALQLGATEEQVRQRVLSGRLVSIHDGVYRVAGAPLTWHARLLAAVRAAGPHAYASHHSFARLYDLRGTYDARPEITVLGTQLPVLRGVRVHRIDRLARIDTAARDGIPCLAPPLGLLTLGSRVREVALHNAVHDALFQRFTTAVKLDEILRAYGGRGRRGTAKLRRALRSLPASGRGSQTGLELELYRLLVDAEVGDPELQLEIHDGDGVRRTLDVAYLRETVDLEADGRRDHTSPAAIASDARRDAAMRAIGWEPRRYRQDEIRGEPDRVVREVQALLAARRRSLSI